MNVISKRSMAAMLTVPAWAALAAQPQAPASAPPSITVTGSLPSTLTGLPAGPEVVGTISSRRGDQLQVTGADGSSTTILVSDATKINGTGGLLGLDRTPLRADALLNGLPVTVRTVQWEGGLVASQISFRSRDLATARMIQNGTAQRFGEHDVAIARNTAATEALRSRVADIDQYDIKGTTNVYFDTGKWNLSPKAETDLCAAADQAKATNNALLLVIGYTDSVGSEDYNQTLSEKRTGKVVNYLQQHCGWAPYRMLTPTGMAEADPAADNSTPEGRAQNRRVAVNIMVSKAVEGL